MLGEHAVAVGRRLRLARLPCAGGWQEDASAALPLALSHSTGSAIELAVGVGAGDLDHGDGGSAPGSLEAPRRVVELAAVGSICLSSCLSADRGRRRMPKARAISRLPTLASAPRRRIRGSLASLGKVRSDRRFLLRFGGSGLRFTPSLAVRLPWRLRLALASWPQASSPASAAGFLAAASWLLSALAVAVAFLALASAPPALAVPACRLGLDRDQATASSSVTVSGVVAFGSVALILPCLT